MIFNLKDDSFSHAKSTVGGKVSKFIIWDRSCQEDRETFYTNEKIYECHTPKERSFGILYESRALIPKVYRHAPKVMDRFKHIFTYDSDLLKRNSEIFKFAPAGGIWIGDAFGGGSIGIKRKSKMVSMVSSKKRSCPLHRFRYRMAKKLSKEERADVYGLDRWIHINESLEAYRYSVVVENNAIDNYFTEKILNCFAVGTIPIYYGCQNIDHFFHGDGIIRIGRWTNMKKLIDRLREQDYESRMAAIKENFQRCLQYEIIEDYIYTRYFSGRNDVVSNPDF